MNKAWAHHRWGTPGRVVVPLSVHAVAFGILLSGQGCQTDPARTTRGPDFRIEHTTTLPGIGAGQGLTTTEGRVLAYGDAETGVILDLGPLPAIDAGSSPQVHRQINLTVAGRDIVPHPTGLAIQPGMPTFLGNTVRGAGTILTIDLEKAHDQGTLDGAVLNSCSDDLAANGCRPEYVRYDDRWLIATADYGNERNSLRLYDPARLAETERTSEPSVLVAEFPCGPWVQSIEWVEETQQMVLVQNQIAGLLYRFTLCEFAGSGLKVTSVLDFTEPRDELEGFVMTGRGSGLMLSSSREHNFRSIRAISTEANRFRASVDTEAP